MLPFKALSVNQEIGGSLLVLGTVLAVVLSVVAAFVPAWRAGTTPVVTGLRAE
jgi:ABC-type lipoprotein release transport system permease subunit